MDLGRCVGPPRMFGALGWAGGRGLGGPPCASGGIIFTAETPFVAASACRFLFRASDFCGGAGIAAVAQLGNPWSDG